MEMKCLESSELPAIGCCASWKLILYILPPKACCSKVKPSQRLSNTAWLTLNANEEKRQEWIKEKWDLGNKSRFSKWGGDHAPRGGCLVRSQGAKLLSWLLVYVQIPDLPSKDSESIHLGCGPRIRVLTSTLSPQGILRLTGTLQWGCAGLTSHSFAPVYCFSHSDIQVVAKKV